MTLEELQIAAASHERQLQLIREQLELIRDLARIHDGQIRELSAMVRSHEGQTVELRQIVREVAETLKSFIASLAGRDGQTT